MSDHLMCPWEPTTTGVIRCCVVKIMPPSRALVCENLWYLSIYKWMCLKIKTYTKTSSLLNKDFPKTICIYLQEKITKLHMPLSCTLAGPQAPKNSLKKRHPRICWIQWLEKKTSNVVLPNGDTSHVGKQQSRTPPEHANQFITLFWKLNSNKGWLAAEELQTESFGIPRLQQSYNASTFCCHRALTRHRRSCSLSGE